VKGLLFRALLKGDIDRTSDIAEILVRHKHASSKSYINYLKFCHVQEWWIIWDHNVSYIRTHCRCKEILFTVFSHIGPWNCISNRNSVRN